MQTSPFCFVLCTVFATTPQAWGADTFFSDTFANGSTLNSTAPAAPTATNASYQLISAKSWNPSPSLSGGDLKFGIAKTSSGAIEVQARFAATPVTLIQPGDYVELMVTFTNTTGLLTNSTAMGFGLYNSGGIDPLPGGLNGTATSGTTISGGAQHWVGYVAQVNYSGASHRIMTRPDQTGTTAVNQDLVTSGSSSMSYIGSATVGSASASSLVLTNGGTYTEDLVITLLDTSTLSFNNSVYAGVDTAGDLLTQFSATSTGPLLTAGFDGLAIGWRYTGNTSPTIMDISSIRVTGQATTISGPPELTTPPVTVSVPAGAACAFTVQASGYGLSYQWHRYGTNLVNGGNVSGANSSMLVISPAGAEDVAAGSSGYYVTVTGAGGFSTNSATAALSLRAAADLTWSGTGDDWDLNTSQNWMNGSTPSLFNFGDNITFNDAGIARGAVNLAGSFLSAGSVTVNASQFNDYVFSGSGNFAGNGKMLYLGAGHLSLNNANSYSGGTLISNAAAYLVLNNYGGLGTGPVTLAEGQMEIVPAGSATSGIKGDIIVQDDFTIMFDANSSYAAVFMGNISGTPGKTLTLTHNNISPTPSRIRAYGAATVFDANIVLTNPEVTFASYQASGSQTYNGVISGPGAFMQKGTITYLNGANTYSGGTSPASGTIAFGRDTVGTGPDSGPIGTGPLYLAPDSTTSTTGRGMVMAAGSARTIANPIQFLSGTNNLTLAIGGSNDLTFSGAFALNGNDGVAPTYTVRTLQVDNTALTTFTGVISDGGAGFGLIKTGNGTLALNNAETYSGPTTVSNGTLLVNGQLAAGSVTIVTNTVLSGGGTILGPVTVLPGGVLAPGASLGTLTINNDLSFAGNLLVEVNKSASPSSDKVVVSGALNNTGTGTVTVTNLGPTLAANDTFTLFSKPLLQGANLTVTGMGATWANNLATDGTIKVLSVTPTTPTNITFSVSAGVMMLSWPPAYTGWVLEAQTNASRGGLSTSWSRIADSATVNQLAIPVNPANGSVFFRLVYP